jgi:two-component system cell cycle sensor histidine kinase/response regulator CckA
MALSEPRERYEAILEALPLGLLVFDLATPERRIVEANDAAARILGYDQAELIGLKALDITVPEDLEREQPFVDELLDGRRDRFVLEKRYVRRDGELIWGRANVSLLRRNGDAAVWLLKLVDDVTPDRAAAEERDALAERLRGAQKMEALGRLAGGVAHDFNNLLQALGGHAQLALEEPDLAAVRGHLRQVLRAADQAAQLTSQLLTFSRKRAFERGPIDVNEVIAQIQPMLGRLLGPGIEFVTELSDDDCTVECDRTQLEQIVLNLVINARDAMPQGGRVELQTTCEEQDGARYVVLVVSDTGVGMDAETLERSFDPFFTTKELGKGTGLGLSVVDGIVGQSGGDVNVDSAPGEGTRFEIRLPASSGPADTQSAPLVRPVPGGDETVLVVDDDTAVRELASEYLEGLGYRVLAAGNADEAVELFARQPADLLVTDVVMPKTGGQELYRLLSAERPGLPVLYMSGYAPAIEALTASEGTGTSFLQKPYAFSRLGAVVRELLDASRAQAGRDGGASRSP